MRRIAISGHRGLAGETSLLVEKAIRTALDEAGPDVTGISCLADGADQIFARAVTDLGGGLEAIIPADRYRDSLPAGSHSEFDRLLALAANAYCLLFTKPTPESFMAAGELMVDNADVLYAVWDGQPGRGPGGTADVVAYAYACGTPVNIIWPTGAQRDLATARPRGEPASRLVAGGGKSGRTDEALPVISAISLLGLLLRSVVTCSMRQK